MMFRVVHQPEPCHARSPFRVVEQTTGREVDWINRYLDRVYHPDRLLYPMRRVGPKGSGQFARITWDEAIAEISMHWKDIIDQHGSQCILPYSYAGTLGLVQGSVADSRFWNKLLQMLCL